MHLMRETQNVPEMQAVLRVPRFFWMFTSAWHKAKKSQGIGKSFWERQRESLEDFDKKNPKALRPMAPTITSPPAKRKTKITPGGKAKTTEEPARPAQLQPPLASKPTPLAPPTPTPSPNIGPDSSCGWSIEKGRVAIHPQHQ